MYENQTDEIWKSNRWNNTRSTYLNAIKLNVCRVWKILAQNFCTQIFLTGNFLNLRYFTLYSCTLKWTGDVEVHYAGCQPLISVLLVAFLLALYFLLKELFPSIRTVTGHFLYESFVATNTHTHTHTHTLLWAGHRQRWNTTQKSFNLCAKPDSIAQGRS